MKLSVVMIVKNEEAMLGKCLESVKEADEIVITDTGSKDKTKEVALKYTNKFYENEYTWNDNFAEARNYAKNKATGDWIFVLDADEVRLKLLAEQVFGRFSTALNNLCRQLDPELDLFPGEFYPGGSNFGIFMDSCPDRWGQMLMRRREVIAATEEDRTARNLDPWDFLLGVQDCTRMGALRYSMPECDTFLANEALSAPPVAKIAELQTIAFEMTRKKLADSNKIKKWLKLSY